MVGVVFIHSICLPHGKFGFYDFCHSTLSDTLCGICVPLFFFFSGFMFFQNVTTLDFETYKLKMRRRIKSLLIPFIFWNLFVVAVIGAGQLLVHSFFSGAFKNVLDFDFKDWLSVFYSFQGSGVPMAYQLWFLRDLILMSALTPLIFYLCKYLKFWWIAVLMILHLLGVRSQVVGLNFSSLFFYCSGCWYGINKCSFGFESNRLKWVFVLIYGFLIVMELLLKGFDWICYLHEFNIIVGCIAILQFMSIYNESRDTSQLFYMKKSISNASFFLYCYHGIFAAFIAKFAANLVHDDFGAVFVYFADVILLVVFGVLAYNVLLKLLPSFTRIITGCR